MNALKINTATTPYNKNIEESSPYTVSSSTHEMKAAWVGDAENHKKHCLYCGTVMEEEEHMPGAEATEWTAQTCTECGWVITPATGHIKHHMTLVPGKEATCAEAGSKPYYTCSGCDDWFADKEGTTVITDHDSIIIPSTEKHDYKDGICVSCGVKDPNYDEAQNPSETVETGDHSKILLWLWSMIIAVGVLTTIVFTKKRSQKK